MCDIYIYIYIYIMCECVSKHIYVRMCVTVRAYVLACVLVCVRGCVFNNDNAPRVWSAPLSQCSDQLVLVPYLSQSTR